MNYLSEFWNKKKYHPLFWKEEKKTFIRKKKKLSGACVAIEPQMTVSSRSSSTPHPCLDPARATHSSFSLSFWILACRSVWSKWLGIMGYYSAIEYKPIDNLYVSLNRNRFTRVVQRVSSLRGLFQGEFILVVNLEYIKFANCVVQNF